MVADVNIRSAEFRRFLNRAESRIYPRAAIKTLNKMAQGARKEIQSEMDSRFENARAFSKRGVRFQNVQGGLEQANLESQVFLSPKQAAYLQFQIFGGTRTGSDVGSVGDWLLLPAGKNARKTRLAPSAIVWFSRRIDRQNVFTTGNGFAQGQLGVFERLKTKRNLLAVFVKRAEYEDDNLPWGEIIDRFVSARIVDQFTEEFNRRI